MITFQCDQTFCLNEPVQFQCIVNGSIDILRWRIRDESMTTLNTETYSNGDSIASFLPIPNAPDFSTDLSSMIPLISNISFTVQSSINGYTILCEDFGGDSESCTINIEGEYLMDSFVD